MNVKLRGIFVFLVLHILNAGCASPSAGLPDWYDDVQNFERYVPTKKEIRNLSEAELIDRLGTPFSREDTEMPDGKRISKLNYFYIGNDEEPSSESEVAHRLASYYFKDGKFIKSNSISSFIEDSTKFDLNSAKLIKLDDSYAKVVDLLGEPSGMTASTPSGVFVHGWYGSNYSYQEVTIPYGEGNIQHYRFLFDANDKVRFIISPSGTIPGKGPED